MSSKNKIPYGLVVSSDTKVPQGLLGLFGETTYIKSPRPLRTKGKAPDIEPLEDYAKRLEQTQRANPWLHQSQQQSKPPLTAPRIALETSYPETSSEAQVEQKEHASQKKQKRHLRWMIHAAWNRYRIWQSSDDEDNMNKELSFIRKLEQRLEQ